MAEPAYSKHATAPQAYPTKAGLVDQLNLAATAPHNEQLKLECQFPYSRNRFLVCLAFPAPCNSIPPSLSALFCCLKSIPESHFGTPWSCYSWLFVLHKPRGQEFHLTHDIVCFHDGSRLLLRPVCLVHNGHLLLTYAISEGAAYCSPALRCDRRFSTFKLILLTAILLCVYSAYSLTSLFFLGLSFCFSRSLAGSRFTDVNTSRCCSLDGHCCCAELKLSSRLIACKPEA